MWIYASEIMEEIIGINHFSSKKNVDLEKTFFSTFC